MLPPGNTITKLLDIGAIDLSDPLKVMFVMRPVTGGIKKHLFSLLQNLNQKQIRPIIVCSPEMPEQDYLGALGAAIYHLPICPEINPIRDWQSARILRQIIRQTDVDIVHAHSFKAGYISVLADLLQRQRRKYAFICTFHNQLRRYNNGLKNYFSTAAAAGIGRKADRVVVISRALLAEAVQLMRLPETKVTCVYNGINPSEYAVLPPPDQFRREYGIPEDALLVGTVARLIPQKGIQYLIRAALLLRDRFPKVRYVITGDGPMRQQLERQVQAAGLAGIITFAGFRPKIDDFLAAMDLFALPTLEEGLSIAVMEAMAAAKPVIASAVGGVPELITAQTGVLVQPGDAQSLADGIGSLLSMDGAKRAAMGADGRNLIVERFTDGQIAEEHVRLYEDLARQRRRGRGADAAPNPEPEPEPAPAPAKE